MARKNTLRYITEIDSGYWVRFTENNINVKHQTFPASQYGSKAKALRAAKRWRDEQEEFNDKSYYSRPLWTDNHQYYIYGLTWAFYIVKKSGRINNQLRGFVKNPRHGSRKTMNVSIELYGLRESFNRIISFLESAKLEKGEHYPERVKKEAWRRLSSAYYQGTGSRN